MDMTLTALYEQVPKSEGDGHVAYVEELPGAISEGTPWKKPAKICGTLSNYSSKPTAIERDNAFLVKRSPAKRSRSRSLNFLGYDPDLDVCPFRHCFCLDAVAPSFQFNDSSRSTNRSQAKNTGIGARKTARRGAASGMDKNPGRFLVSFENREQEPIGAYKNRPHGSD
jgi:hypothetical protein